MVQQMRVDDSPTGQRAAAPPESDAPTYQEALRSWRSIEDINHLIGERFVYDKERAIELSETRRSANPSNATPIHEPEAFYQAPKGVCVDLARFAFETAKKVAPAVEPHYLMLEFEPITIDGETLRRHWLVIFTRDGRFYSFGDSKRPGHIAGPFPTVKALVADYQSYRQRTVVAAKVMDDFRRRKQMRQMKSRVQQDAPQEDERPTPRDAS